MREKYIVIDKNGVFDKPKPNDRVQFYSEGSILPETVDLPTIKNLIKNKRIKLVKKIKVSNKKAPEQNKKEGD